MDHPYSITDANLQFSLSRMGFMQEMRGLSHLCLQILVLDNLSKSDILASRNMVDTGGGNKYRKRLLEAAQDRGP